jgi:penicillin G amidase
VSELTDMLRERARAALPKVEGTVRLPGLREPVEVLWDRWGVPHIYARNTRDLYFAQGYVMASERLFQMDFFLRLGSGQLSQLFGEFTLPMDRFIRTLGWNRAATHLISQWDDLALESGEAAMDGIRTWIERMPSKPIEYEILSLDPELPDGMPGLGRAASAAVFMAWSLSGNWDAELLRAEISERLGWEAMVALFPDVQTLPPAVRPGKRGADGARRSALDLLRAAPPLPGGQGSNNWVVSGSRSATGMPLLANDPHILAQMPSIWFEAHLSAPGIDVRGVALPFAPGIVLGHNERIAWGATNVGGDVQDLYLERLNPEGTAALFDGMWEPLTVHREEIAVRGRAEPEILEVKETRHGPILDSYMVGLVDLDVVQGGITETYALRWVGLEEGPSNSTVHRLNTAENFEQFRAALEEWTCPGQNFVYADVDGNIGYQCTGIHPIRGRGDGTLPVPGWDSEYEWQGYVPFEELPWAYNPEEGFIATANAKPHDDTYPYLLGHDFLPPFRARRVAQMITERDRHDVESFAAMQFDWLSLPAMDIVPRLLEAEPHGDRQKQAVELLANWDRRLSPDSAAAAVYQVWCIRLARAILLPQLGQQLYEHFYAKRQWSNEFQTTVLPRLLEYPTARWFGADGREARDAVLRRSLDEALDELTDRLGEDMGSWSWGAIHPVRFVGRLGNVIPDLAGLFTGGEAPWGGDEMTVNQGTFDPGADTYQVAVVASWREIIDLSDLDNSIGTHTVGQSGNPASPHFNDLFPLWSKGQHHPLPFTRHAVEAVTKSKLDLVPEEPAPT